MRKMLKFVLIITIITAAIGTQENDPATNQIVDFKKKTSGPIGTMRTSSGAPVEYKNAGSTLNTNLLTNEFLLDAITHVTQERIPERIAHARGSGGFGYFETTHDISHVCKAKIFCGVGKKTPIAIRFSPVVIERGGAETLRDIRGFAVKFYTEDGNFDIVAINTPIFLVKDPILFMTLLHSLKRNPATNLFDKNMFWDVMTQHPESFFLLLYFFGDLGIPDGYRHMPGHGVHTYEVYNEKGEKSFVRFHFTPEAGIKNLNVTEAAKISGTDPDYATRDLYTAIANNECPSWLVSLQILSPEDVKKADFNVFDITRILPTSKYPLHPVGRFVLNKNPINHFAEIEQLALCPGNLIPGILGSPDKSFELRRLAYRLTQNYRLGANFNKIPVNYPIHQALNLNRDGVPPVKDNGKDAPNYYPNSFNGPLPVVEKNRPALMEIFEDNPYNFDQAADYYVNELASKERKALVENIVTALCPAASFLRERAIKIFTIIHFDLGVKVARGVAKCKSPKH